MPRTLALSAIALIFALAPGVQAASDCVRQEYMKSFQSPQGQNRLASIIKRIYNDVFQGDSGTVEYLSYSMADLGLSSIQDSYKAYPTIEYQGYEIVMTSIRKALSESMKRHGADTVQAIGQICIAAPECLQKDSLSINLFKPGRERPFIMDTYRWSLNGFKFEKTEAFDN